MDGQCLELLLLGERHFIQENKSIKTAMFNTLPKVTNTKYHFTYLLTITVYKTTYLNKVDIGWQQDPNGQHPGPSTLSQDVYRSKVVGHRGEQHTVNSNTVKSRPNTRRFYYKNEYFTT